VATLTGAHAERVLRARELQSVKGRKEHGRFVFEGPTLLEEALRSGVAIEELFVTEKVLGHNTAVRELDERGTPVYLIDDRAMRKISDVETPTGLVAVAEQRTVRPEEVLAAPLSLALADLSDPGNVGTLLRSAEAFGIQGVILGRLGVDPYHPKVVRGAMGALFRLRLAVAGATEFAAAVSAAGAQTVGLLAEGPDIASVPLRTPAVLVVGHERHGLGAWEVPGMHPAGIPMHGPVDSLNAATAGSIGLYVLAQRCQESPGSPKSQDFPR